LTAPAGVARADRERALRRLHARIRACTKCVDAGILERARPVVAGSIRDRIAIVGQAPGAVELTTGQPFSGRSGAELRRWLDLAGIDQDHLPYRTAITKCFPGKAPTGSGDRRPSPAGKVPLEAAVGRSRMTDGVTFIPLPHPSGASRWLNDPAHRELLRKGLAQVRRAARALDREEAAPTMRAPRQEKRGASFHGRASKVR